MSTLLTFSFILSSIWARWIASLSIVFNPEGNDIEFLLKFRLCRCDKWLSGPAISLSEDWVEDSFLLIENVHLSITFSFLFSLISTNQYTLLHQSLIHRYVILVVRSMIFYVSVLLEEVAIDYRHCCKYYWFPIYSVIYRQNLHPLIGCGYYYV